MNWEKDLEKNGYCVIENVLSAETCDKYIKEIWNWLESIDGSIKRDDKLTWAPPHWPLSFKGIVTYPPISHTQFAWDLRDEPNIKNIYKTIWKTDDLITCFSRINITQPFDEKSSKGKSKSASASPEYWFHTDMAVPQERGFETIQGFINLENSTSKDAGLVVLKGSHVHHETTFKKFLLDKMHDEERFFEISKMITAWLIEIKGCGIVHIAAPKGAFVLWDSRTFHCNSRPTKFSKPNLWRYVEYICMVPRGWITKEELAKKHAALFEQRSTGHNPHIINLFAIKPKYAWNFDVTPFDLFREKQKLPQFTPSMLRLAGFTDDEIPIFPQLLASHKNK
ncbi:MAG: hypothetical protein Hyperionvirus18_32 [Hyperionvirus sp.]|uniref:Phytanoyl-CoA dioxygenase n=1 Tax=Hyperionvirus sp. TaxID=2487770 RepID=A0A3G5AA63_9VIRU|nr:MAG: hypothetical protein Hyperionvirus18_32 [Hyperionvirus sp.]